MTILSRYITREILRVFFLVLIFVVGIYVAVDFLEKIGDFSEAGLGIGRALVFYFYRIPFIVAQVGPVAFLLSVLIAFGLMNRQNEIVALKSSGVSVYSLLKPLLGLGFAASAILFVLSEMVVPAATARANAIWYGEVHHKAMASARQQDLWMRVSKAIVHVAYYHPVEKRLYGIRIYRFANGFHLTDRIDARSARIVKGEWHLRDAIEQHFDGKSGKPTLALHPTLDLKLGIDLADLTQVVRKSEEMGIVELYHYIHTIESEGYDAVPYRVDFQAKIAFPFVCVVMAMAGLGIAVRAGLREGLPMSITFGIGTAFFYWIFFSLTMSLGYGGRLPPWLAAWCANLVFLCLGGLALMGAE